MTVINSSCVGAELATVVAAPLSFEEALLRGEAKGFAVCAKSLRFARLPEVVATTYAEIGGPNCFYVFEAEDEARRRLAEVPSQEQLGWQLSVREISYRPMRDNRDGPKLDLCGHPFAMRGFLVDRSGVCTQWQHPGWLGWRDLSWRVPSANGMQAGGVESGIFRRMAAWVRGVFH